MASQWVSEHESYERLFDSARGEVAIGEVSPVYLQTTSSPRLISELCPEAKIIAILRHPVDRAYAHFLGRRRDGLEQRTSFEEVVRAELSGRFPDDIAFGHYLGCGRYHHFLRGYFERFPSERIRIYLFEELERNTEGLISDLFDFISVDPTYVPDAGRHNRTGEIRNPILRHIWTGSVQVRTHLRPYIPQQVRDAVFELIGNQLMKPELDAGLRAQLVGVFRADIRRLAKLIDRDLSGWLDTGAS